MRHSPDIKPRNQLLACYQAALQAVHGRELVKQQAALLAGFAADGIALLAIGKAAVAMADGALELLGERITEGLIITKTGYAPHGHYSANVQLLESAHPVPDERSLQAGEALLEFVLHLPANMPLLVLISGGASALVEVPVEGVGLAELQAINNKMLASGLTISEMNRSRQRLSLIKGGGLLNFLGQREVLNCLLSDVPGNDPAVIGSGLLVKANQATDQVVDLPESIARLLPNTAQKPARPDGQARVKTVIIGDNQTACHAAALCAQCNGHYVEVERECLTGEVTHVVDHVLDHLMHAKAGVYIWGGEPLLELPARPGRGGRNQHLALMFAKRINRCHDVYILVAATDGSDGPTDDAGGLVDGQTVQRGEAEGLDIETYLSNADAGTFLEASGDLLSTGPTDSNVMDLIIAFKTEPGGV